MKYTIKLLNKFRENLNCNPKNPKVISTYTEEFTVEDIKDVPVILKNLIDVFEENRIMNPDDVRKLYGVDLTQEKIDNICNYYNFRLRAYNTILDELSLINISMDSDVVIKRYSIPYSVNHFEVRDLCGDQCQSEQLEAYYELKVEK